MRFVYMPIQLNAHEVRVARCRAEAALRERNLARKFAAAKKRVKVDSSVLEVSVPVEVINTEVMDITVQDMTAGDMSPHVSGMEEGGLKEEAAQDGDGCPEAAVTPSETVTQEDAARLVRRSLLVPARFRDRLAGTGDYFIEYLEGHHSVKIFQDSKRGMWHIKGHKCNVLSCYTSVKELITEWRRREAVDE